MSRVDGAFRIAVASGKGGTGKTTVAVSLAVLQAQQEEPVQYLDCDVEEPNGHIFLKPAIEETEEAGILIPVVDPALCDGCRKCGDACEFHAIVVPKKAVVFPELCHGCGGCLRACPTGAITEAFRAVGVVECGKAGRLSFVQGLLNIGEAMAPPLIRAVKKKIQPTGLALLDAPPGTACAVVTTVKDADYVLLVTEPTPFGLNDLKLAVELMRSLGRPFGVVVNRACGDDSVRRYCREEGLALLAEIPDDRAVAESYSRGELPLDTVPSFRRALEQLKETLSAACEAVGR
ncbi:MAG: ATP-binding protein [Kiritimatiellae bacterium]|nr:ATP-binding protein [Kiritimatiellia bacterium]